MTYILKVGVLLLIIILHGCTKKAEVEEPAFPNIVIIYTDDLGLGDVGAYGAQGVETPNVDFLVRNGIRYTDAHSSAATCTPSRYSLLTGEYAFRSSARILEGDAPLLIDTAMHTLPKMLQRLGYSTAVIGKWHLGLGLGKVDWNKEVKPGPLEVGFDYSFLMPATGDRVPTVYLENYLVKNLNPDDPISVSYKEKVGDWPTGIENPELLRYPADKQHSQTIVNGVSRIGTMVGGKDALWVDEDFPDLFTQKAIDFMDRSKEKPFFLFFSFHDIHVPRLPHDRFKGKSTMGLRGDAIVQMDWMTGRVMEYLEENGLSENTLLIFTSDNGPVLDDGYDDMAEELLGDHDPSGGFRGGKYSIFEAGTRVPMVTYWPGKIQPGVSDALISQTDYYASIAGLLGEKLLPGEAKDSKDVNDVLINAEAKGSTYLMEEAYTLGIRKDNWKYIQPVSEDVKVDNWMKNKKIESGLSYEHQLYDLSSDPREELNLAGEYPELVDELQKKIDEEKLPK